MDNWATWLSTSASLMVIDLSTTGIKVSMVKLEIKAPGKNGK